MRRKLHGLDLTIDLPPKTTLRYTRPDDLFPLLKESERIRGNTLSRKAFQSSAVKLYGLSLVIGPEDKDDFVIAVRKGLYEPLAKLVRAHEEVHLLKRKKIGKIGTLLGALLLDGFDIFGFCGLTEEAQANAGGLYALRRRGISIDDKSDAAWARIAEDPFASTRSFKEALRWYRKHAPSH